MQLERENQLFQLKRFSETLSDPVSYTPNFPTGPQVASTLHYHHSNLSPSKVPFLRTCLLKKLHHRRKTVINDQLDILSGRADESLAGKSLGVAIQRSKSAHASRHIPRKVAASPLKDDAVDSYRVSGVQVEACAVVSAADIETRRVVGSASKRAARDHGGAHDSDEKGCQMHRRR